jgi:hypothetical protein
MKNRIIVIFTLFAGLFLLNSCLKDTADYWPDEVAGKMYATVLKPALQSLTMQPTTDTVDFSFMINIATDALPTNDVTLTLAVDPTAVATYNSLKKPKVPYQVFPTVRVLNPTVTIPAGTRTYTIHAQVWNAKALDACTNYIAAITIKSVSDPNIMIPANMKSYLLALPISNPYEGNYMASGTFTHPTAGVRTIDEEKELSTVNCKAVKGFVGDLGAYDAIFTVNADYSVTVSGEISASQPLVQSGVNKFDPATETFTVNYYYVGSGGNRVISETLVRIR